MARQRFIWPDFWEDPELGQLEPVVQLFFIGCFSNADDEGRLLGNPSFLRATIFPYLDFSLAEVTEIRDAAVAGCSNLEVYEVDGAAYLAFNKWSDYQKPKYPKPSKLPAPPSQKSRKRRGKPSRKVSETLGKRSPKLPAQGRVGQGREVSTGSSGSGDTPREPVDQTGDLPFSTELLLAELAPLENGSAEVLRGLAAQLPEGSVAKVLESLRLKKPKPKNPAGYVRRALESEIAERQPPPPRSKLLRDDPAAFVETYGWELDPDALEQLLAAHVEDSDERIGLVDRAADLRSEKESDASAV